MELLFNLLWFAIAAGTVVTYLRLSRVEGRDFRLGLGALLCILMLLLPAISITDDLHFEPLAVEDSSLTKRLVNATVHAVPISQVVWFAVSLLELLFALLRRTTRLKAKSAFTTCRDFWFSPVILGRAPPSLLAT